MNSLLLSRRRLGALTMASGAAAFLNNAHAQFKVEVTGVGTRQIPIAVAKFRGEDQAGQALAAIVRSNLERSGFFKGLDNSVNLDETSQPAMTDWRAQAADALVAGSVSRLADGRFDVRYKLWDVVRGADLGGRSDVVLSADLRLAAHRASDFIYEKLTGEKGVFATRIAYVTKVGRVHTLWVADADGLGRVDARSSNEPLISPAWSPDGRELAFVSFEKQKAVVYSQVVASGQTREIANFRGTNSAPAWAPDGQSLAVTIDTESTFSPDGKQIYFVSDRGGSPQIYRISAAGGGADRVTFSGSYNISPSISPDGRTLAYISRIGGAFRLHVMDLGSGSVKAITETNDDERPSFAPNGQLIVYASRIQGRDVLMTTTVDGRVKARLATTNVDVREPVWGPYGR
jgi:TolB protein